MWDTENMGAREVQYKPEMSKSGSKNIQNYKYVFQKQYLVLGQKIKQYIRSKQEIDILITWDCRGI